MSTIKLPPKYIYQIDAAGALVSACLLGVVLVKFESIFTMPKHVLQALSIAACVLALHSFLSYYLIKNKRYYLKVLALVNTVYCCVTIRLVIYFNNVITIWDWGYFIVEIMVVLWLSSMEWRASLIKSI